MDKIYSATYQKTSSHSGKTNGSLELMKFRLILKPESKEGCIFYVSTSNQHKYEVVDIYFLHGVSLN